MDILLIAHDLCFARLLVGQLEKFSFVVDHEDNGRKGLFKAMNGRYKLFIVDINLSEMEGFTLIEILRARGNQTPILGCQIEP